MKIEYNTTRPLLPILEYGRNIKKLIDCAVQIEDKEKRTQAAQSIVRAMAQVTSHPKDSGDFWQKIWDHLFILADFQLDVDSPYPKPDSDTVHVKPAEIFYPKKTVKYRYYGQNIQNIIKKIAVIDESDRKSNLVKQVANHMKKSYLTWNRDNVSDEVILNHLADLSGSRLKLDEADRLNRTSDILAATKKPKFVSNNNKPGKFQRNKKNNNQSNYKKPI
ncbi:MAG: DUF4290 domain-containing protein [Bacteroidales bacterium]|nr:DUF4290 domain-containing protein [Bacteroidales bacterium]